MKIDIIPTVVTGTLLSKFARAAEIMYLANGFTKLEVKPTLNPQEYLLKVTLVDLRVFEQALWLDGGVWHVKFNVPDFWNPIEYTPIIAVRESSQALIEAGITNIKIDN